MIHITYYAHTHHEKSNCCVRPADRETFNGNQWKAWYLEHSPTTNNKLTWAASNEPLKQKGIVHDVVPSWEYMRELLDHSPFRDANKIPSPLRPMEKIDKYAKAEAKTLTTNNDPTIPQGIFGN